MTDLFLWMGSYQGCLVAQFTEPRQWGFLGEPRVNVLKLNLALVWLQSDRESLMKE